jgi:DNA-binding MarR family transcriptional regulator
MQHEIPTDLMPVKDARILIGVSHTKMTQLIRDGFVRTYPNVLDRREKLVSKAEVLALRPYRAEAA